MWTNERGRRAVSVHVVPRGYGNRSCWSADAQRRRVRVLACPIWSRGANPRLQSAAMTSTRLWDRAGALTVPSADRRRPEIVALPARLPTLDELFTFMRDAELRFETLLMRIEERTFGTRGEQLVAIDVALRHPGDARG